MESIKTRAIVARRREYGESNCMLTLLSGGLGVISASCYGVKSKKSKLRAASQVFTCCDFILSKKNGDVYRVESAEIVDSFYPVCEDIVKLSLANYLCDLSLEASQSDDGRILSLLLNTLYILAYREFEPKLVKSVFEIKLAQISGYEPSMDSCIKCGMSEGLSGFDLSGGMTCKACQSPWDIKVSAGLYRAVKFILDANDNKIFAFTVSHEVGEELSELSEKYILAKTERSYKSLDYLKKIM